MGVVDVYLSRSPANIVREVPNEDSYLYLQVEDVDLETSLSSVNMSADILEDEVLLSPLEADNIDNESQTQETVDNDSKSVSDSAETTKSKSVFVDNLFIHFQNTQRKKNIKPNYTNQTQIKQKLTNYENYTLFHQKHKF